MRQLYVMYVLMCVTTNTIMNGYAHTRKSRMSRNPACFQVRICASAIGDTSVQTLVDRMSIFLINLYLTLYDLTNVVVRSYKCQNKYKNTKIKNTFFFVRVEQEEKIQVKRHFLMPKLKIIKKFFVKKTFLYRETFIAQRYEIYFDSYV